MTYTKKAVICICTAVVLSVLPYFFLYRIIELLISGEALPVSMVITLVALTAVCLAGNALLYVKV